MRRASLAGEIARNRLRAVLAGAIIAGILAACPACLQTARAGSLSIRPVSDVENMDGIASSSQRTVAMVVSDLSGNPVAGINVGFEVISGGGRVDPPSARTDAHGRVATLWTIGHGTDALIKATVHRTGGQLAPAYVWAGGSELQAMQWRSGLRYYANLTELREHDDRVLETAHFLIFSDRGSDDGKVLLAMVAERALTRIGDSMDIPDWRQLGIGQDSSESKIKIYADATNVNTGIWIGANNPAIIYTAVDSRCFRGDLAAGYASAAESLIHEITHMVQLLLVGCDNVPAAWPPTWFTEGIAEYYTGGSAALPQPVRTREQLEAWIDDGGHRNPLLIEYWDDFLPQDVPNEYYAMFELVMRYLLDEQGAGCTPSQIRQLLQELRVTHDFSASFGQTLGISPADLRDELYERLHTYLSSKGS